MKICFISHTEKLGGAERVLFETIAILRGRGIDCYVLLPKEGEFSRRLVALGVPFDFVHNGSWVTWDKPTVWARTKAVAKITIGILSTLKKVSRSRCDIVYSNTLSICNGAFAATILRIPHVWHLHDFPGYHGISFYFGRRFSLRTIGALSAICITVSKHLSEICAPYIDSSKLMTVYPAMRMVEVPAADAKPAVKKRAGGRFQCVIVGGLVPTKRQEDAVRALGHLHRNGADADLTIVGGGDPTYRKVLEEIAASDGVSDRLHFTGAVADALPSMQKSDVVLVCSAQETFGRATIEGMLAGRPVVAARAAATPELIRDGVNGLLYTPGDSRELGGRIKMLYHDPVLAQGLAERGRTWARTSFTEERYAREILSVLTAVGSKPLASKSATQATENTISIETP
jgi:glycosyltransferase involved in cell wall biosynthesis